VLAGLSDQPDHTMRISELAGFTNAELSRLSHLITRLQKRGYVGREPDPNDGRYTNAVLTDAGYNHLAAAPGHVATVLEPRHRRARRHRPQRPSGQRGAHHRPHQRRSGSEWMIPRTCSGTDSGV